MFSNVLKNSNNYLDRKTLYIVLIILGICFTIVVYNRLKSDVSKGIPIPINENFITTTKSIININKHKLYDNPKTVSFARNNDVMYFNESGFLREERERM
jgi:hypothetical protein